jgi:hypothetical protein
MIEMALKIYVDDVTGEVTEIHSEAMEWFRGGHNVKIYTRKNLNSNWEYRTGWEW